MKKPENVYRAACALKLRKAKCFGNAIETGATGSGVPDQYMTFMLVEGCKLRRCPSWVEYKVIRAPFSTKRKIPFQPGQLAWLNENEAHGGYSFVCIKYTNGYLFVPITRITADGYPESSCERLTFPFDAPRVMQIMARHVADLARD
jgi:hypothetical protein